MTIYLALGCNRLRMQIKLTGIFVAASLGFTSVLSSCASDAAAPRGSIGPGAVRTYSTSCSGVENPLSESGNWLNGGTDGIDWANFRKNNGQCWGLQTVDERDATALVKGPWIGNQYAQATAYLNSPNFSVLPELELRLRSNISANVNSGYEIDFFLGGNIQVVRWNGSAGDFDRIGSAFVTPALNNGDVLYAQIVGNIITIKVNGATIGTIDVSSIGGTVYNTGLPGIGHNHVGALDGTEALYGFTAFTCGEL
jgi:hypothetical protein